jgi:menaquinone-9 beta-reductase
VLAPALKAMAAKRFVDWSFNHYLDVAHPDFVAEGLPARAGARAALAAA